MKFSVASILILIAFCANAAEEYQPLQAVQLYSQDELALMIRANRHLDQVAADDCQLNQDIEARASVMKLPTYQFLYGDMLAWGVCVDKDPELGLHYMKEAAQQGFPEALEQLGRYYRKGILVQANLPKALLYLREASAMGNLKAQLQFVELLVAGEGSPEDYYDAYRWLHQAVIGDKQTHAQAAKLLSQLADMMPPSLVAKAQHAGIVQ